jgi:hypothetical protein
LAKKLSKKQQTLVDELTRRVNMCREFMNDWLLFNQVLSAYPSPGANKAELENQFLKIKSKLAREHNVLREVLQADYNIDGNTMNIVSSATNLESIYSQSEIAVKKTQGEWHRAFISINETLGTIEDKKGRAEMGEKIFMMVAGGPTQQVSSGMGGSTKNLIIVVVIIAALAGLFLFTPLGEKYKEWIGM